MNKIQTRNRDKLHKENIDRKRKSKEREERDFPPDRLNIDERQN